jgi:hypothetical protein
MDATPEGTTKNLDPERMGVCHPDPKRITRAWSAALTVHLTGVNAEIEKEAEALLLAEIAKAADEPSFQTLKGNVIDAAKLKGGDDA